MTGNKLKNRIIDAGLSVYKVSQIAEVDYKSLREFCNNKRDVLHATFIKVDEVVTIHENKGLILQTIIDQLVNKAHDQIGYGGTDKVKYKGYIPLQLSTFDCYAEIYGTVEIVEDEYGFYTTNILDYEIDECVVVTDNYNLELKF